MSDKYPSYEDLFKELKNIRQEIKVIMDKHNIYDWPYEEEFPDWVVQESRLTPEGRCRLSELGQAVVEIKQTISNRLGDKTKKQLGL